MAFPVLLVHVRLGVAYPKDQIITLAPPPPPTLYFNPYKRRTLLEDIEHYVCVHEVMQLNQTG
jgi:hypothetical protein